jgi:SSS family solute:Na+ symporter
MAFSVGLSAWWFTLGAGIALLVMATFYAAPLRASKLQTIPQFLTLHYGPRVGKMAAIAASIGIFFSIVANILSATPLVSALFHTDSARAVAFVMALTVFYVVFGGVWATGRVGIWKTVFIYITLLAVAYTTYTRMGGWHGFCSAFPSYPWFSLVGRGWGIDLGSGLSLLVGTLTTQTYIQALFSASNEPTAKAGAVTAALVALPSGIPAVMVGLFMRVHHPNIAPIDALPLFVLTYLPPWLGGLAIAALLLAAIGSAAGLALGVGTMLNRDLLPALKWRFCETHALLTNRLVVFLVMLGAATFTFGNLRSLVLEWNFLSMGLRGAGIFFPFSLAIFCPGRISPQLALLSIVSGTAATIAWKFIYPQGTDPLYAGLAVSALVLGAAVFIGQNNSCRSAS